MIYSETKVEEPRQPEKPFTNPKNFPRDTITLIVQHDQVINFILDKIGVTPQEFNEWTERKLRERDGDRRATDEELRNADLEKLNAQSR